MKVLSFNGLLLAFFLFSTMSSFLPVSTFKLYLLTYFSIFTHKVGVFGFATMFAFTVHDHL